MAKSVSHHARTSKLQGCFFLCLSLLSAVASAQSAPDPTRPPDSILNNADIEAVNAGPVLQSVLVSPGRNIAIINGQSVKLHQKFGDFRLVHIGETEVILRNGKETQTLKLFPEIKAQLIHPSAR